ncbi:MAG TPA: AraC family transcriptional regulator [Bacteroides reticulotermitis]|nr:AraC family transcriptional regulator [Bacteroides reticulotermitis]
MIYTILSIAASYLSLFFAFVLIIKKNKHISDYYLAGWLVILGIYIISLAGIEQIPKEVEKTVAILHGSFLFIYIKNITYNTRLNPKDLIYFLPFIITMCLAVFCKSVINTNAYNILSSIVFLAFIVGAIIIMRRYNREVKNKYSNIELADTAWLNLLIGGNIFFLLNSIIANTIPNFPINQVEIVAFFIFMTITGLKSIGSVNFIIHPTAANEEPEQTSQQQSSPYTNYGLKDAEAEKLATKLKEVMLTQKLYLNQELSLKSLAESIDTYPHYITQILNSYFKQNFYDFVNQYRIEEAERMLIDPAKANLTILAIAYECGFNSKATFNRVFKTKNTTTPSQYKQAHLQ